MNTAARHRVAPGLRYTAYLLTAALWLTGCAWLLLQWLFRPQTDFGPALHPLQPPLLLVHGVLAVPGLYFLGWISPGHAREGWRVRQRRVSGGLLWIVLVVLAASGFALFFVDADRPRAGAALVHEILGVSVAAAALVHWQQRKRPR